MKQHLLWWKQELGHCLLSDIKPSHIAQKRDKLLSQDTFYKRPRSPTTVVRYIASLSHAFSIAVKEWEWMDENPIRKINKPKLPQGRIRFLDESEKNRLLDACNQSHSAYLYPIVVLALTTGMRKGEILTLNWHDVDFERSTILLRTNKNGERRMIPLIGLSLELLRRLYSIRQSKLVFPSPKKSNYPLDIRSAWENALQKAGIANFKFHDLRHTAASYLFNSKKHPSEKAYIRKHWEAALKKANLNNFKFHFKFHDLRHTAASYLAMSGANAMEIALFLGHKTLHCTKRYTHFSKGHLQKMAENHDAKLFNNIRGEIYELNAR